MKENNENHEKVMKNIRIRDIEVYHGERVVDNEYYFDYYKRKGQDVKHFFEDIMGRKKRFLIDPEKENVNTMAVEAAKRVLEKSNLKGEDIDMIIFSTNLAQYTTPNGAVMIHNAIKGNKKCLSYDLNLNCAGMECSLNLAYKYMQSDSRMNYVLIVGSDYLNLYANRENAMSYGQYGDASCALILERTDEDSRLMDYTVSIDSDLHEQAVFPNCGFSNIYDAERKDIEVGWTLKGSTFIDSAVSDISTVLDRNNLKVNDITVFCLSQFSYKAVRTIEEKFNITKDQDTYIGDIYGYTGTTSPFIALYEAIKNGRVHRGDYIVMWTVAAGVQYITLLLKY